VPETVGLAHAQTIHHATDGTARETFRTFGQKYAATLLNTTVRIDISLNSFFATAAAEAASVPSSLTAQRLAPGR
jgi:hypothetical protein